MSDNKKFAFVLNGKTVAVAGAAGVAGVALSQQEAEAITVADVTAAMDTITAGADTTADAALPIGAAIIGIGVIGMVLRRFIMA